MSSAGSGSAGSSGKTALSASAFGSGSLQGGGGGSSGGTDRFNARTRRGSSSSMAEGPKDTAFERLCRNVDGAATVQFRNSTWRHPDERPSSGHRPVVGPSAVPATQNAEEPHQ